jgi:polysaccharide pyruvyl transferase CsaB
VKLLVSGYYGYGNLGDEALLQGMVAPLKAAGHHVTVLSGDPVATRALHGVEAAHRYRALLISLLTHDALISGGGGLLQDKTSARSLQYYLGVIRLARALGKTVVVYGQSIGPLSPAGKERVARALRALPVAVRDRASQQLLDKLGVTSELCADPALTLPSPSLLPAEGAPVLLVPRGGYPTVNEALVQLARALAARGQPLAAMAIRPVEDEAPITALVGAIPGITVWTAGTPSEALAAIARARHVVSARLHGLILAAATSRSFSGIVYDPKVAAFLEEAGAVAHAPPVDITSLVEEVERGAIAHECVAALKARAMRGLEWLERTLAR